MTAAIEGGECSAARLGRTLPPGKTRYPLYRRLGGPQGHSGRAENLVPTGIRSRTVQLVAQSLYRLSYRAHFFLDNEEKCGRTRQATQDNIIRHMRNECLISEAANAHLECVIIIFHSNDGNAYAAHCYGTYMVCCLVEC